MSLAHIQIEGERCSNPTPTPNQPQMEGRVLRLAASMMSTENPSVLEVRVSVTPRNKRRGQLLE